MILQLNKEEFEIVAVKALLKHLGFEDYQEAEKLEVYITRNEQGDKICEIAGGPLKGRRAEIRYIPVQKRMTIDLTYINHDCVVYVDELKNLLGER